MCVSVCHILGRYQPQRPEEFIGFLGPGDTGGCQLPDMGAGN